jgi:hypothetical protein
VAVLPVQVVVPNAFRIKILKKRSRTNKRGCRAINNNNNNNKAISIVTIR